MNVYADPGGFRLAADVWPQPNISEVAARAETAERAIDPDAETARRLIRYDPETGKMYWNARDPSQFDADEANARRICAAWNRKHAGQEIGALVPLDYVRHKKARIAWLISYGSYPEGRVYHANGDTTDCRLQNLTLKRPKCGKKRAAVPPHDCERQKPAVAPVKKRSIWKVLDNRRKPGSKCGATVDAPLAREFFRYEPETGRVFWRERDREYFNSDGACKLWNVKNAGKEIRTYNRHGRFQVCIFGKTYLLDRIIWLMEHGEWPDHIEHIDKDVENYRLENLRAVSRSERELKRIEKSVSGVPGVYYVNGKWSVREKVGGLWRHVATVDEYGEACCLKAQLDRREAFIFERESLRAIA